MAPGDAVACRPRTYRSESSSVSFTTTEPAEVVTTLSEIPVVIHRTFLVRTLRGSASARFKPCSLEPVPGMALGEASQTRRTGDPLET